MIILSAFLLIISAIYTSLLLLYRKSWKAIPFYHSSKTQSEFPFISLVIPARNEAENLPALISDLRLQNLSPDRFEVLIVDDHSSDNTPAIIAGAGGNIRLITLADHISEPVIAYKKKAIETAIDMSKGEVIVTTDADCKVKPGWLSNIAGYFGRTSCEFLVMPVAMNQPKNFFQTFQALDFMTLQGITGAALHSRWHYMCNGANLAYRRDTFRKVNGFEGIDNIASGDDMLLMEKVAANNRNSIHYLKSEQVIVETAPCDSLKAFFRQRARWAGKSARYKSKTTTSILLLVYLLNFSLLVSPVIAFFFRTRLTGSAMVFAICWIATLLIKTFSELYFLKPVAVFFKRTDILKWFPLAQPFHIVYVVFAGFLGMAGRQSWKGRKV